MAREPALPWHGPEWYVLWDPRWQSARWGLKWPRRAPGTRLKQTRPLSTPTAGRGEPPRSMPSVCSFKCLYNMRVTVWVFKVPEHPRGKPQVTNRTWSVETQVLVEGTRCFFPEPVDLGRQMEAYCPRAADRFPDGGTGAAARGRLPHESRVAWPPPGFWPHVVWGLCARGQQFLHGGPGLLPTDSSGTCLTSPRTSQGTGGSATRAGLSSQLSPALGPAARPFLHLHVPQSFPAQPPPETRAGLGDHSWPVKKRQAGDRARGCPGRACRIPLGSSPAFPLVSSIPGEQVWSKKGIMFWMEGLIVNLAEECSLGTRFWKHRDSELECTY